MSQYGSSFLTGYQHTSGLVRQKDGRLRFIRHKAVHRRLDVLPPAAGIIVDDDEPAWAHARVEEIQRGRHCLAQIAIDMGKSEFLSGLDVDRRLGEPSLAVYDVRVEPDESLH